MKMKKLFLLATAVTVMASCTNNEIVGIGGNPVVTGEGTAISFSGSSSAITRANYTGSTAASYLNNNFVVEGVKGNGTDQEVVFDNYNVNFVNGTGNTTTSNTNGWEYVAQAKNANASISEQSIKYWDYGQEQYDFIAYSLGTSTGLTVSPIDASKLNGVVTSGKVTDGAYTIEGTADELAKAYIADLVTAYRDATPTSDYNNVVTFEFRSLSAKVRVALYETVPGYSVKDVVFYTDDNTEATDGEAHLYTTGTDVFNEAGKYIVYFPTTGSANTGDTDYNKAHVAFEPAATNGTETDKSFGALDNFVSTEVAEAADDYLGRSSSAATYAGESTNNYYTVVIPNETGAVLNLKVNYTLVSTDGSGEDISVTGATAQVPAVYASWKSGYAYTYIFKISQNGNGYTNPSAGPAGLWPITFDAVVTETEDGVQETISTVATPSITTYSKGVVATANDEYKKNSNIYIVVNDGTELTVGTNAKMYKVTLSDTDDTDALDTPAQTINEASVANAVAQGGTVVDANKWELATTPVGITAVTEIDAADAPDGNAISVKGVVFNTSMAGTYAFEYTEGTNKYYKIIKVQ
jgi:hypothetical protein